MIKVTNKMDEIREYPNGEKAVFDGFGDLIITDKDGRMVAMIERSRVAEWEVITT